MIDRRVMIHSPNPLRDTMPFTVARVRWSGGGMEHFLGLLVGSDPTGKGEIIFIGPDLNARMQIGGEGYI